MGNERLPTASALDLVSGVEREICLMIEQRQQAGIAKYGQTVAENPLPLRAWLQHALEETLDKAIYLKRAINEIDSKPVFEIDEVRHLTGRVRMTAVEDAPTGMPSSGDRVFVMKAHP